jgi:hypothetical protein
MIVGIIPNAFAAESLLNNLSEADFSLGDVSLIMRDQELRDKVAEDIGPLKGVPYDQISEVLVQAGLSAPKAQAYQEAVAQGKVLAVMDAAADLVEVVIEMFTDQSGEAVMEIKI